jgi:hypothetical protein
MTKIKDERLKIFRVFPAHPQAPPQKDAQRLLHRKPNRVHDPKKILPPRKPKVLHFQKIKIKTPTAKMSENTLSLWIRSKISRQKTP